MKFSAKHTITSQAQGHKHDTRLQATVLAATVVSTRSVPVFLHCDCLLCTVMLVQHSLYTIYCTLSRASFPATVGYASARHKTGLQDHIIKLTIPAYPGSGEQENSTGPQTLESIF